MHSILLTQARRGRKTLLTLLLRCIHFVECTWLLKYFAKYFDIVSGVLEITVCFVFMSESCPEGTLYSVHADILKSEKKKLKV